MEKYTTSILLYIILNTIILMIDIYTEPVTMIWLQARAKTTNCYKAQVASYTCF